MYKSVICYSTALFQFNNHMQMKGDNISKKKLTARIEQESFWKM